MPYLAHHRRCTGRFSTDYTAAYPVHHSPAFSMAQDYIVAM